jgi:succinoglycan biosynthesis protein ExoA
MTQAGKDDPALSRSSVDVVVPAFNEESHIEQCLDHVLAQGYPPERIRVWVVDAGSTDRTVQVTNAYARGDPRITLVSGRGRLNAAQALNLGIAQGTSDVIARVDAHTFVDSDYLLRASELLAEMGARVACVGGQPTQVGNTRFGEAVALARRSRFGVGGSVYSDRRERAFVDTVQGGVYRRSALADVGGFAETMLVGEDEECNWRLRRAGYDIVLDVGLRFRYTTRSSWKALYRQYRNYGLSRVRVVTAHPDFARPRHFIPSLFLAGVSALLVGSIFSERARAALVVAVASYSTGAFAAATAVTRDGDRSLSPYVAACFAAQHAGYGIGVLGGIASAVGTSAGLVAPRIAVSRR